MLQYSQCVLTRLMGCSGANLSRRDLAGCDRADALRRGHYVATGL